MRCSFDDVQQVVIIVPNTFVDRVVRYLHESPGGSHQAAKATTAKIARIFYWPTIKLDVKIFISSCSVCDIFFKTWL